MSAGFEFCGRCGAPRAGSPAVQDEAPPDSDRGRLAAAADDESEIKQATILCCELVESAGAPAEPEALHEVLSRFLVIAREEVARLGGRVDQVLGRGFLGLFGAPEAHEDHAVRAVLTAAALRRRAGELAGELEARHGVRWTVRMSVDSGTVITGGAGGTAVGDALDRARRLQDVVQPGEVLLGEELAGAVGSVFRLSQEAETAAGPGGIPIPAWRLPEVTPSFGALRRPRGWRLSPFVGRRREMTLLDELRRQAEAGHGQVVGISGEPGSGKSRLLYEVSNTLSDAPVSYLRGHCVSYTSGIPYFPFVDMICRASHIEDSDDPAAVESKLRRSLEAVGLEPDEVLPYFLRLLGLPQGDLVLDAMEPQAVQVQTFRVMRRMVLAASRLSLVVMEIEDLHWIDETSEEFLASLIEEMAGARLLLLLTYRSGYHPPWLQKSFATQITMRRLSDEESRDVVASILGQDEVASQRSGWIIEKAEGNPFFLEELARTLTEAEGEERRSRIPDTVQGVLMARIDRLPSAHKRLLQIGSALDRELSLPLLEHLWDHPEPLAGLLADLQRWEFLFTAPSGEPDAYAFRHALTQDVAYHSLLKSRRRELHARVARTLETLYAHRLDTVYERLIYHYPRAGDAEKTVHYLVLFAARAAQHYAHAEAAKALREALDHALRLPDGIRERRRIEILLQLAESLLPLARLPETLELCLAHEEVIQQVADPALDARYRFWLAHTYTYLGRQEEARRQAELAIDAGEACGDEATEGKARYVLGRNAFWAGDFAAGLEQSQRAVVLLERNDEPWWQGQAYWVAGFHHWALGQFDQAIDALQRAASIGEALDDYRLDSSWSLGFVQASLGDGQAGIEHCRRGIECSRDPLNTAVAMGFLGYAYFREGDLDSAIRTLGEAMQRLAEAGMRQLLGWLMVFLAEAHLAAGRLEEARETAVEALQVAADARFEYGVGLARRALGRAALAAGKRDEAVEALDGALATFRALGTPFEVARTLLRRAEGRSPQEPRATAADLEEAHRLFQELEASSYAREAEALAGELGIELPFVRTA